MLRRVSSTESPPNFSSVASASTSATIASATTPAAGTAHTSERWLIAFAGSPVATSTVSSALGTVEIGFIAARTRSTSPVVMPPSVPPDRDVRRRRRPSRCSISSWASLPRRRAVSKPSPTSTPLMAWMPISAPARRASSRLSQWVWLPRPGGSPWTTTSTTPPSVSPSLRTRSISSTIATDVSGSAQRTGSASMSDSRSAAGRTPTGVCTAPMATTWLSTAAPSTWSRNALATAPSATRAAVSRALARSSTGRASLNPYFCMPTRSACPGRGRVSGAARASSASTDSSTGSGAMTCSHFGHSLFPTRTANGEPSESPWRNPPRISTSSCSNDIRAPRPYPARRRVSSAWISAVVMRTPAGTPSSTATRAGPCDSPAVSQRNIRPLSMTGHEDAPPESRAGRSSLAVLSAWWLVDDHHVLSRRQDEGRPVAVLHGHLAAGDVEQREVLREHRWDVALRGRDSEPQDLEGAPVAVADVEDDLVAGQAMQLEPDRPVDRLVGSRASGRAGRAVGRGRRATGRGGRRTVGRRAGRSGRWFDVQRCERVSADVALVVLRQRQWLLGRRLVVDDLRRGHRRRRRQAAAGGRRRGAAALQQEERRERQDEHTECSTHEEELAPTAVVGDVAAVQRQRRHGRLGDCGATNGKSLLSHVV